ncbi:hypothetical protein HHB27_11850, partial [Mobiluncus mulieris]|nr:hypothetical protein [Mobiluncus mulieris]
MNPETTPQPATPASTKPEKQEKSNPLSPKSLDTPTFHWNTNQKTESKTQLMGINPEPAALPHCELESREAFRASLALYNFDVAVFVEAHALKHGLDEAEIEYAWNHLVATKLRFDGSMPPRWIGLGSLPDGRM